MTVSETCDIRMAGEVHNFHSNIDIKLQMDGAVATGFHNAQCIFCTVSFVVRKGLSMHNNQLFLVSYLSRRPAGNKG